MDVIDFLTCGGCQTEFPLSKITIFMEHKKTNCTVFSSLTNSEYTFNNYACYTCPEKFGAAVSLLLHAQNFHKQKIYIDRTNSVSQHSRETSAEQDSRGDEEQFTVKEMEQYSAVEIPEPLSKCCTSVVPKKRKRHFETKHRTSFFKAARLRHQQHSMTSNDIYINVEPSQMGVSSYEAQSQNTTEHSTFLPVGKTVTIPISTNSMPEEYLGISYPASSPTNRSGQYGSTSNGETSHTCTASTTSTASTTTVSTAHDTRDSLSSKVVKKKYPTSKPFKCDHCEDSFNQRIHLKKHQSKHTGVKPYKCNHCDYATVERSHLKVHIRIHTGEKPFKCNHCEYSTAQNSTLRIHLKRHHGGALLLECTHCGKQFPEKTQLLWHKQEHGQMDNTSVGTQPSASSAIADVQPEIEEQKPIVPSPP